MIGLCERAGYYTVLSFAVVYLGELGFGAYWPSLLVGSGLGTLVYLLPLGCGSLADRIGYRRGLMAGNALMALGYGALALPLWSGLGQLGQALRPEPSVGPAVVLPIGLGLLLVALGRSLLNPCCTATIQRLVGQRKGMAFGLFIMLTNLGTLAGLALCWRLRASLALDAVFVVALGASGTALLLGALFYRNPPGTAPVPPGDLAPASWWSALGKLAGDRSLRTFMLLTSGFFILYGQTSILMPLYLKLAVDPNPSLDLYAALHPLLAVLFQLPISRASRGVRPLRCLALGTLILGLAMLWNLIPLGLEGGLQAQGGRAGTLGILLTMGCSSLALLLTLPKLYQYLGSRAPLGQEGLYLGLACLPMGLGHLVGGCLGPIVLNQVMSRQAVLQTTGLLLSPWSAAQGWLLLSALGLLGAASIRALSKG